MPAACSPSLHQPCPPLFHLLQELGNALALGALEAQALHKWGWRRKGSRISSATSWRVSLPRLVGPTPCMPLRLIAALPAQLTVISAAARLEEGQHQLAWAVEDDLRGELQQLPFQVGLEACRGDRALR